MATYHKIPKSTDKVSLETYLKIHEVNFKLSVIP